jgi:hypothetical protein
MVSRLRHNKSLNMDGAARVAHSISNCVSDRGYAFNKYWLLRHRQLSCSLGRQAV